MGTRTTKSRFAMSDDQLTAESVISPPNEGQKPIAVNDSTAPFTNTTATAYTTTTTPDTYFTADDIQKARQQEKQKLYAEMERMRNELAERDKREAEAEERRRAEKEAFEAEAKRKAEEEMDVRTLLEHKQQEFEQALESERQEREKAFALLEMEKAFNQLQEYRQQAVAVAGDDIIPELRDLVSGNTPEEIDASIAGLKERSERIIESAQQAMQSARRDMSGARVTAPATGPLDNEPGQKTFTAEELAALPMSEYAKYRSSLIGDAGKSRGLFGS